jgi:flagellar biosynthesis/type III secretory pathway chaperone
VSRAVAELTAALERVAAAMDAEVDAVRLGQTDALSAAVERKRATVEAVEPVLQRFRDVTSAASPAERGRLIQATRRMQTAAERNAATLQGALDGTRRLYACLADAAQAAASSGTYRPDGSRHCAEESVGTIRRSA